MAGPFEQWGQIYGQMLQGQGPQLTPAGGVADWYSALANQPNYAQSTPAPQPQEMGYLQGFGKSALASFPELIGMEAPPEVQDWRAANPIGSIASQVLPMVVPYGAAARVGAPIVRAIAPRLTAALAADAAKGIAPIRTAWKQAALELTPFEAGRIATSALVGDPGSVSDVALSAGLDLGAIPILPAAWRGLQLARELRYKEPTLDRIVQQIPSLSREAPRQANLETLYAMRESASEDIKPTIEEGIRYLEGSIRSLHNPKPLGELVGENADASALRKYFRGGARTDGEGAETSRVRLLYQANSDGYPTPKAWQDEIAQLRLPDDWLSYSELPRVFEAKTNAKAAGVLEDVTKNLDAVKNGWYMREEQDTGLWVMAKKLPMSEGKWFFTKTANPNKLVGQDIVDINHERMVKFATAVKSAEEREAVQALGSEFDGSVVAQGRAYDGLMPRLRTEDSGPTNFTRIAKLADKFYPGMENALNVAAEDVRQAWVLAKRFVAPRMFQFRDSPIANDVMQRGQFRFDASTSQASAINYGVEKLEEWQKPLAKILWSKKEAGDDSLFGLVRTLKEEDMPLVTKYLNLELSRKEIIQSLLADTEDFATHARINRFFAVAEKLDAKVNTIVNGTENLYKKEPTEWLENHYAVNHTWVGDLRRRIVDERKRLIAVASGRNPVELERNTEELLKRYGGVADRKSFLSGQENDEGLAAELYQNRKAAGTSVRLGAKPVTMAEERTGVGGFVGDSATLTREELFDIMKRNVERKFKYQAELSVKNDLMPDILEVYARYGKEVGDQVILRLNQMGGRKGQLDLAVNRAVGRVPGVQSLIGNNPADKIVGAYNKAEYTVSLLAGNLAHAGLQAASFIQTVLPKIAMIQGVPPGRLGEVMGILPVTDAAGKVSGIRNFVEPLLVSALGFRGLIKPTAEEAQMFARAAQDGALAPRFMEEFVGQKSLRGEEIGDAMSSPVKGALKFLGRLSEYLPVKMEELSRGHAFITGFQLAKRMFPEAPQDWAYQFAKNFTERTMYLYGAADKPRLFAGPLGGTYGLFKNWMFHNIADWGGYASEAFKRNNWTPLVWAMAGQSALGGIGSLPLIALGNSFYRMATNGDGNLMNHLYDSFGGGRVTDAIYFGMPALFGVSLQANASAPFSDPTRDINFMFNAALFDRAAKVGKFVDYVHSQTGLNQNPFELDRTWDLASYAFGPRLLYRSLAQVEDGALKAIRNGQPIIDGITFPEATLNALSLTPTRIAKAYELSEDLWRNREAARAQTERLGEAFSQGILRGDTEVMNFVVSRAVELGLDVSHIMRSARDRVANQTTPMLPYDFRRDPRAWQGVERLGL